MRVSREQRARDYGKVNATVELGKTRYAASSSSESCTLNNECLRHEFLTIGLVDTEKEVLNSDVFGIRETEFIDMSSCANTVILEKII